MYFGNYKKTYPCVVEFIIIKQCTKLQQKIRDENVNLAQPTVEHYLFCCNFRCYVFFNKMIPVFEIQLCYNIRKRAELT